jgi:predicted transcriptional regulator
MQLALVRKLIGMFVERIVSEVFPDETGAARLQQLGLFTLIFTLEQNGTPVTAERLAGITGQSKSAVQKQLVKLEDVGVIERRKALSKSGRGRALHLFIKHNEKTERLMKAGGSQTTAEVMSRRVQ